MKNNLDNQRKLNIFSESIGSYPDDSIEYDPVDSVITIHIN